MANFIDNAIDYSRQMEMEGFRHDSLTSYDHVVIGCGGIGYWTAIFLAMMGAKSITLIDGDNIESSNVPRLPVGVRHIGQMKVRVLKATLRLLRPMVRVAVIPTHLHHNSVDAVLLHCNVNRMARRIIFIWDCTDDARIQKDIALWADISGAPYRKLGYDGWRIGSYGKGLITSMWISDDTYRPGYTTNSSNVLSSVVCAALGILREFVAPCDDNETLNDNLEINLREAVWTQET